MAFVYSTTFYEDHDLDGDGPVLSPPAGSLWIVRGVDSVLKDDAGAINVLGSAGECFWANSFGAVVGFAYASYRGRFVIGPDGSFQVQTDVAMDVAVWGYQLALP